MPKHNKNQIKLQDVYKFYCSKVKTPVDYKTFKKVLDTWGSSVIEYLVAGRDVKLHHGVASVGIRKKVKATYVDRRESKLRGEMVKKSNAHSGFYGARVYWRRHYTVFNSKGWVFRPTRELRDSLNAVMTTPGGHRNFLIKAMATSKQEQASSMYNKKIHKV